MLLGFMSVSKSHQGVCRGLMQLDGLVERLLLYKVAGGGLSARISAAARMKGIRLEICHPATSCR